MPVTARKCFAVVVMAAPRVAPSVSALNVTTGLQSSQTFTVVRSVNGVVRIHAAGESVSLFTPSIVPLA